MVIDRRELEHSGFVGIIGRPNVGKSTLINAFAQRKLAIVSERPQTTRHTIRAVINIEGAQVVLIDTPGLHKPKDGLGKRLNAKVKKTMEEVDAVLFVVDAAAGVGKGDMFIAKELGNVRTPVVIVLNKIDAAGESGLIEGRKAAAALIEAAPVMEISAANGTGLEPLLDSTAELLPPGPKYYPDDILTDQPERVLIGELIREKLIRRIREELPYAVAVEVVEVASRKGADLIDVFAKVHVERDSQKGIVIGKSGAILEEVGKEARAEIEALLGSRVYLDLVVKVTKSWRRNERKVEELGY